MSPPRSFSLFLAITICDFSSHNLEGILRERVYEAAENVQRLRGVCVRLK
jgi:hypothetical protein